MAFGFPYGLKHIADCEIVIAQRFLGTRLAEINNGSMFVSLAAASKDFSAVIAGRCFASDFNIAFIFDFYKSYFMLAIA